MFIDLLKSIEFNNQQKENLSTFMKLDASSLHGRGVFCVCSFFLYNYINVIFESYLF